MNRFGLKGNKATKSIEFSVPKCLMKLYNSQHLIKLQLKLNAMCCIF